MIENIKLFWLGVREFRTDWTTSVDDDKIEVYDAGREFAHRVTFRKYDSTF